jgi:hypothetical protein
MTAPAVTSCISNDTTNGSVLPYVRSKGLWESAVAVILQFEFSLVPDEEI